MGELAALFTSFLWSLSSISFSDAGKKVGSVVVNRIRLPYAVILITLANLIITGSVVPVNAGAERWFWLGLSGIMGLAVGDSFLFQAYILIGPRLAMLVMASAPVLSTIFAWIFLKETLAISEIIGIVIAVVGISLVVLDGSTNGNNSVHDKRHYSLGLLCAFGGAVGQASGLILAKRGLIGDFPVISGVWIRMMAALITIWLLTLLMRQGRETVRIVQENPSVLWIIALGAVVGPFLGVWMSLISVRLAPVGIASTLMALTPIFLLPIAKWSFKEQVTMRALLGTFVTMVGIAVIFLFQ